jgi:hypothetical protein
MAVWECPGCHRRVPDRITVCHCGTRRDQAATTPAPAPVRPREFARPRFVAAGDADPSAALIVLREGWPYVLVFTIALMGAAVWGVRWQPERLPPLLGWKASDRPSPSPSPSPRPRATPR